MSTRSFSNTDEQFGRLQELYGDELAHTALTKIDALLAKYRAHIGESSDAARLSEKDVLLITYGDTLTQQDVAPLQVLRKFHHEHLLNVFDLVHILPFHPYSSDDGFSVIDYFSVREDLGDWDDISDLASECDVMADAVINHMSSRSDWFAKFLSGDPDFSEFFVECDPGDDLSTVVRPRTSPLLTEFKDTDGDSRYMWTTFSADQVDLNFKNPDVLVAVIDVLFFLVSKGARLLRLDAVTFLWKEPGTTSANLPQTHALIKVLRSAISALRSDVVVITETNVPHRENVAYFGGGYDEAHMVYNFALPPLLAYSFIVGDGQHLSAWAKELATPSSEVCFLNFSASHDGVGVRPVEEILDESELRQLIDAAVAAQGLVSSRMLSDGEEHPYELNCTFLDLISKTDDDVAVMVARFVASQAIVLAMPGVPAVYIQSLLGTRNDLDAVAQTGRARSINRTQHRYANVESKLSDKGNLEYRVLSGIKRLIEVRREHSAFNPYAAFRVLELGKEVFAIERGDSDGGATISCVVNLASKNIAISVDTTLTGFDLLSGETFKEGHRELSPFAVHWIKRV